jgi:hypothetical protein
MITNVPEEPTAIFSVEVKMEAEGYSEKSVTTFKPT